MTETRETKLTDSETKMLRERLSNVPLRYSGDCSYRDDNDVLELLSELLLAAKERSAQEVEEFMGTLDSAQGKVCPLAEKIRESSWGDLFEVK